MTSSPWLCPSISARYSTHARRRARARTPAATPTATLEEQLAPVTQKVGHCRRFRSSHHHSSPHVPRNHHYFLRCPPRPLRRRRRRLPQPTPCHPRQRHCSARHVMNTIPMISESIIHLQTTTSPRLTNSRPQMQMEIPSLVNGLTSTYCYDYYGHTPLPFFFFWLSFFVFSCSMV